MHRLMFLLAVLFCFTTCSEPVYTPKPRGYPRVDFPERAYKPFEANYCSFTFEQPVYSTVVQDTTFFNVRPEHPCWFNIEIPSLNGTIHCNYKPLLRKEDLGELVNDSYDLANKHNIKADFINDYLVNNNKGVSGAILEIEGSVASPFQFYLTDSTNHFFRGSLYFNSRPEPDSMRPVIEFVREDIVHMINTFEWN